MILRSDLECSKAHAIHAVLNVVSSVLVQLVASEDLACRWEEYSFCQG